MNSVKHWERFTIDQPAEVLFPLFSAEGEKLWVPGWDYVSVTGSTELHEDYVFLTKTYDHAGTDAIWLVKRYEPADFFVQFYRVEVTYQYTALGERGEEFIEGFTASDYSEFIAEWKRLLQTYFDSRHRWSTAPDIRQMQRPRKPASDLLQGVVVIV